MIPIRFKENCRFHEWTPALQWIFEVLHRIRIDGDDLPPELVITSVNDSVHKEGSRHYTDEGLDLRSKSFSDMAAKVRFKLLLQAQLNSNLLDPNKFIVLHESIGTANEHFHIQVRRGARFSGV